MRCGACVTPTVEAATVGQPAEPQELEVDLWPAEPPELAVDLRLSRPLWARFARWRQLLPIPAAALLFFLGLFISFRVTIALTQDREGTPATGQSPAVTDAAVAALPAALRPLVLAAPASDIRYQIVREGSSSYASLSYRIDRGTVKLPGFSGPSTWRVAMYLHPDAAAAGRHLQTQLRAIRAAQLEDPKSECYGAIETELAKGDECYLFSKVQLNEPQYVTRWYILRQGATWLYITAAGDAGNPAVPGDGVDALLTTLKQVDNRSLLGTPQS